MADYQYMKTDEQLQYEVRTKCSQMEINGVIMSLSHQTINYITWSMYHAMWRHINTSVFVRIYDQIRNTR